MDPNPLLTRPSRVGTGLLTNCNGVLQKEHFESYTLDSKQGRGTLGNQWSKTVSHLLSSRGDEVRSNDIICQWLMEVMGARWLQRKGCRGSQNFMDILAFGLLLCGSSVPFCVYPGTPLCV